MVGRERKREKENLRFIDGGAKCSWGGRGARRILSWERCRGLVEIHRRKVT